MKRRRVYGSKTKGTLTVTIYHDGILSNHNKPVYLLQNGEVISTVIAEYSAYKEFTNVEAGTYTLQTSNGETNTTTEVVVNGDTSFSWNINIRYTISGVIKISDNTTLNNTSVTIINDNTSNTEYLITNSSGVWTSNSYHNKGDTIRIITIEITAGNYILEALEEIVTVKADASFNSVVDSVTITKTPLYDVFFTVGKNGYSYASSATKPNITFNGETQTVSINGNTFTGVRAGSYQVKISATTYNDSYSQYISVSSTSTNFSLDVVGYYDIKVTYVWYSNDNTSNSINYCYGATVYLRSSSGSNLYNTTTNSSGLATISIDSYRVGNNTYTLYVPAVKLTNGPYVYSSTKSITPNGGYDYYTISNIQLNCYQYTLTYNLYRSGDSNLWTSGSPSCILYAGGSSVASGTFSSGYVTFSNVYWKSSYFLSINSTSYNEGFSESTSTFGSSTSISKSITVTGKYYIKFELYNSYTGSYFSNCSVLAYLQNSSGSNICSAYTDSGGDITFTCGGLFTYGTSFRVYVPSQTVSDGTNTWVLSSITFSKSISTSYTSASGNYFYFRNNSVTTTKQANASSFSWSASLTSNSYDSYGNSYSNTLTTYNEGLSLAYNEYGVWYQVLAEDSNYLASNSYLRYDLGGMVCWGSYDWSLSFEAEGYLGLFREQVDNGLTGMLNFGVRLGSASLTTAAPGRVGYNVAYGNTYTYPTLLVDNSQSSKWSLYAAPNYWTSGTGAQWAYVTLNYYASSNNIQAICYYYLNGTNQKCMQSEIFSVSLSDDSSESYLTIVLAGWCWIRNVSLTGYKK